ncbi:MAG: hypothetical protein JSS81_20070 [Acidobacteria bacterium]|nr:hypothetical protein [Acidobacteriota bacterium]
MNIKQILPRIWSVVALLSIFLLAYFYWSGGESPGLLKTMLVLDALLFVLALPTGVFGAAVVGAAWYVLELDPVSSDGVYLNTIVLALLGTVQWFWLRRFWYPAETPFQKLALADPAADL